MVSRDNRNHNIRYGDGFWRDYARKLIKDPQIAIVEIVANSWDAGAYRVDVTWPDKRGDVISVRDDGTGMSYDEFIDRWYEVSYSRVHSQGPKVQFPGDRTGNRRAFGRNGKGRHSMFCFDFEYGVETYRDGRGNRFKVERTTGRDPFTIAHEEEFGYEGHGTEIFCTYSLPDDFVSAQDVRDLIGSKFVADPQFEIYINTIPVQLEGLEHLVESDEIEIDGYGTVKILLFDSEKTGRTSKQHGVAWWVNKRLVGIPSWTNDIVKYLDARTSQAKRYTFVILADILEEHVQADWTGFENNEHVRSVVSGVNDRVLEWIQLLFRGFRGSRRNQALRENSDVLNVLSHRSQRFITSFADDIQAQYPPINQKALSATVRVLANLENARTGYDLLEQLAKLPPGDLDALSEILKNWSVRDAQVVLDELDWRLRVIKGLEKVIEVESDELHEVQPLFNRGLWIFGPEYDGVHFMANKWLATVVRDYLQDEQVELIEPQKRPDIVVLPNSSIELYSRNSFDDRGEVDGIEKVLIVELKRGGFEVTRNELIQAEGYANQISMSGKIKKDTEIVCFVLGTQLAEDVSIKTDRDGNTKIYPRTYSTAMLQAHTRTFRLIEQIEKVRTELLLSDNVVNQVSD